MDYRPEKRNSIIHISDVDRSMTPEGPLKFNIARNQMYASATTERAANKSDASIKKVDATAKTERAVSPAQKAESDDVLMHKKEPQAVVLEPEPEDFVFPPSRIPRVKPSVNPRHGEENLDESRDEFNAFDLSQELMKFDKPLEIETS